MDCWPLDITIQILSNTIKIINGFCSKPLLVFFCHSSHRKLVPLWVPSLATQYIPVGNFTNTPRPHPRPVISESPGSTGNWIFLRDTARTSCSWSPSTGHGYTSPSQRWQTKAGRGGGCAGVMGNRQGPGWTWGRRQQLGGISGLPGAGSLLQPPETMGRLPISGPEGA